MYLVYFGNELKSAEITCELIIWTYENETFEWFRDFYLLIVKHIA